MLRKILIAAAMCVASSNFAFAETLPYVGADIGVNRGTLKLQDATSHTTNASEHGMLAGAFAGIGGDIDEKTYLAAEVFAHNSTAQTGTKRINTSSQGPASAKLQMSYNYGLSLIPGYKFTPDTMLYARVGVIRGHYILNQSVVPATAGTNTKRYTSTGAEFGLGLQGNINKNWAVRGEYDYSAYRSFTAFGNRVSPRDNQFNLGLVYKIS